MRDGGETTVLHLGSVEGHGVLGELEAFLDERGEFADAATLLAEDFLGVGCADDWEAISVSGCFCESEDSVGRRHTDICNGRRNANFDA